MAWFKVSTIGSQIDPDGYSVTFSGHLPFGMNINDTVEFKDLEAGEVQIAVGGIADNCDTDVASPLTLQIRGGETTDTTVQVTCVAIPAIRNEEQE